MVYLSKLYTIKIQDFAKDKHLDLKTEQTPESEINPTQTDVSNQNQICSNDTRLEEFLKMNENNSVLNSMMVKKPTTHSTVIDKNSETEFDLSDIDKDTKAQDMYDENNIPEEKKGLMILGSKGNVDSGAWDNVFKELDKIKPQLLEYIKKQMESKGFTYNLEIAEKYLNVYITDAVSKVPVDGKTKKYSFNGIQLKNNPTIEDLIDYIKALIDQEMGNTSASLLKKFTKPFNETTNYTQDHYLVNVADYFLTDDEKEMKFVMEVVDNENTSHKTSDKNKLLKYINTYAKHIKHVLEQKYPNAEENLINDIIDYTRNTTAFPSTDKNGFYSIDDALKNLEKRCLERAEKVLK